MRQGPDWLRGPGVKRIALAVIPRGTAPQASRSKIVVKYPEGGIRYVEEGAFMRAAAIGSAVCLGMASTPAMAQSVSGVSPTLVPTPSFSCTVQVGKPH